ncbi:MAG TPA: S8 family serine peptidase, partial [Candidatus Ozemobacteraceae bacterium]|nr:S8 family serine peptidase [Candidatus Ozemobacteraceae bacterium]
MRGFRLPVVSFLCAFLAGPLACGSASAGDLCFITTRESIDSAALSERIAAVPMRDRAFAAIRDEGGLVSSSLHRIIAQYDANAREIWAARGVSAHLSDGQAEALSREWPSLHIESIDADAVPVSAPPAPTVEQTAQPSWNHVISGAWDLARLRNLTGKGVMIGVVGPAVPFDHPSIADRIIAHREFGPASASSAFRSLEDLMLLHPLGIIAGRIPDSTRSLGTAPDATIALATLPRGKVAADDLLEAIQWLIEPLSGKRPAAILFAVDFPSAAPRAIRDALTACRTAGILPILPAGNNPNRVTGMAALPDVMTIGALDQWKTRASFSGCGPASVDGYPVNKPDYMEPGLGVMGPASGNTYKQGSGTLQAAAHFAGVWAQIRQAKPDTEIDTILVCLSATAKDLGSSGIDTEYGLGLPDPLVMLQYLENPAPPPPPPPGYPAPGSPPQASKSIPIPR